MATFFNVKNISRNNEQSVTQDASNESLRLWEGILEQQAYVVDAPVPAAGPEPVVVAAPVVAPVLPAAPAPVAVPPVMVLLPQAVAEPQFHHFNIRREGTPAEELIAMGQGQRHELPEVQNHGEELRDGRHAIIEQRRARPVRDLNGHDIAPAAGNPNALFHFDHARMRNADPAEFRAAADRGWDVFELGARSAFNFLIGRRS